MYVYMRTVGEGKNGGLRQKRLRGVLNERELAVDSIFRGALVYSARYCALSLSLSLSLCRDVYRGARRAFLLFEELPWREMYEGERRGAQWVLILA